MTIKYESDVTGRETEDENKITKFGITKNGMMCIDVDVHEDDHPDEIRQTLAERLQSMDLSHFDKGDGGLEDLFG